MTGKDDATQDLVALLEQHREAIIASLVEKGLTLPDSHYCLQPRSALCTLTEEAVGAIIEALATASYHTLDAYLSELTALRVSMGFDISEVVWALLLFQDVVRPLLWQECAADPARVQESSARLDTCLRWAACRLSELYATAISRCLRNEQDKTALMLKMAHRASSSLELGDVLREIAGGVSAAVGVGDCLIYLVDEKDSLLVPFVAAGDVPAATSVRRLPRQHLDPRVDVFVRELLRGKAALACCNVQADPRLSRETAAALGAKSVLGVPFVVKGRVLAVALACTFDHCQSFTEEEVRLASGIADTTASAIENALLHKERTERLLESRSVQEVIGALLAESSLKGVLEVICANVQRLLGVAGCAVLLLGDDGRLRVAHSTGAGRLLLDGVTIEGSLAGTADLRGTFTVTGGVSGEALLSRALPGCPAGMTTLSVPLNAKGRAVGAMTVLSESETLTEENARVLLLFADHAAMAILNARLYEDVQQLAVMKERSLLAREMHDSVATALASVILHASVVEQLLSNGQVDEARASLIQLKEAANLNYTAVRDEIFHLRAATSSSLRFLPSLREYLAEYHARFGTDVQLVTDAQAFPEFPPDTALQITRVIQEALTNASKHSSANSIWVRLGHDSSQVYISVEDDGVGFDVAQVREEQGQSLGLQIMRERAESVGGELKVDSQLGHGTRIQIRVPFPR